ncbi:RHS repeat-associated core domain-containing protein [Affinibrenneria salicis]
MRLAGGQSSRTPDSNIRYLCSEDSYEPLARVDHRAGRDTVYYFHTGLPLGMTDEQGDTVWRGRFSDWGETEYESHPGRLNGPQNLRFQGQYLDRETGLHYNLLRYYDPQYGRFTQPDPIGLLGGLNNYAYAPNPLTWIDPLGLAGCTVKMQPYRDDVLVKGPHADVFVNGRKVSEARLGNDGQWFRWGEMANDRKVLKEVDKAIKGMENNSKIMTETISQTKRAIREFEQVINHGKPGTGIYQQAERGLIRFKEILWLIT